MKNEYEKQAQEFLTKTKTTLEVVEATEQTAPLWSKKGEKHGIRYEVTLKNDRAKYIFDFWDSIKNAEIIEAVKILKPYGWAYENARAERVLHDNNIGIGHAKTQKGKAELLETLKPSAYNILACLNLLSEDNFEDFCSSFGYETDSIMALKTFEACKEQDRQLRRLFSMEEIELLTNIQ